MYDVLFHYLNLICNAHDYHKPIGLHLKKYVVTKHTLTHPTTKNISLQTFQLIWKLSSDISSAWRS